MNSILLRMSRGKNLKLIVAYEGTHYLGWQKTNTGKSIEETLQRALEQVLQEKVTLQAASRTDRGVHAEAQVVNLFTAKDVELEMLVRSLNALLPKEISVRKACWENASFHPTLDATGKEYHYFVCNKEAQLPFFRHFSWHVPAPLDLGKMQQGALAFLGKHDFSAFCNERALWTRGGTCEIFALAITPIEGGRMKITVRGDHFLYKMVRNIVGTLVYVGMGKIAVEKVEEILKNQERTQAGITAPAHGLFLHEVFYNKAHLT